MQYYKALYTYECLWVHPHLRRAEMRKLGAIAMALSPSLCLPTPPRHHQTNFYWFWNQLCGTLPLTPTLPQFGIPVLLYSYHFLLFSSSLSGKPESYAEYFSLNRTTAELLLLKPIDRELHSRFDLVIKVRNTKAGNSLNSLWKSPKISIELSISKSRSLNKDKRLFCCIHFVPPGFCQIIQ